MIVLDNHCPEKKNKNDDFPDYRCEGKSKDDDDKEELVVLGQKGK